MEIVKNRNKIMTYGFNKIINKEYYFLLEKRSNNIIKILGEKYYLNINYKTSKLPKIEIKNRDIFIELPNKYKNINEKEIIKILTEKIYNKIALEQLEEIMEKTRLMLSIAPEDYKISRIKGLLGICLYNSGEIVINPDIMQYSKKAIEYVVLHEFCHLKFKTHSKGFYKMIETYMPNYKEYVNEITSLKY